MHVVVVGAGVIGLSSALYLARQGLEVTLVDRNDKVAQETSFANGGQLSYSYVAPLADPSVFGNLPKWLLSSDSPLRFRPRLDLQQWSWCASFLRACTNSRVEQTIREMLNLSSRSQELLEELLHEQPIDFNLRETGKLIIYRSPESLRGAMGLVELQKKFGSQQSVVTAAECREIEPTLSAVADKLAGGILTPSEATGDCMLFCEGLRQRLENMPNVKFKLGQAVLGFEKSASKISAVRLTNETIKADEFVIASGISSVELVKPLGISLPLYPLRGYSLTVRPENEAALPRLSVTDANRKIVYAPLGNSLRIAAMVDMGVKRAEAPQQRIDLLKDHVREVFPDLDLSAAESWAGLRPATALSKPIIDRASNIENLWLNVGHGALGFTLACASGELIAKKITKEKTIDGHKAFLMAAHL